MSVARYPIRTKLRAASIAIAVLIGLLGGTGSILLTGAGTRPALLMGVLTLTALIIASALLIFLSNRILDPLSVIATTAERIAAGQLQNAIPPGGNDEMGALLRSLTTLQNNIQLMMRRETLLRHLAENRLSDALETSQEGVLLVDTDGLIALANKQLGLFFPKIADRLVPGMPFSQALRLISSQVQDPRSVYVAGQVELELRLGGWVRMTANATSEGSVLFFSDFTAIKEREEVLRKAMIAAEAANAAKSRFLANMGHELRTPLNAIIGFSEIIQRELFGAVGDARYVDYSADILKSGRRLLDVINAVLDLSKTESGKMVLDWREVALRDVLEDCAAIAKEEAKEAGVEFTFLQVDMDLKSRGDPARLRQIFLNLLSNAVKFTPRGGHVWLDAKGNCDNITVIVKDNGIGMSENDLAVALEPFGQVDNRLERRYEGAGLGLSLVKALITLHQGHVTFDTERDSGTCVTVTLPIAAKENLLVHAG